MSRRVLAAVAACVVVGGVSFWRLAYVPAVRHYEFCQAVDAELKALARRRPPGVTPDQWRQVVGWTISRYRGCLGSATYIRQADRDGFLSALRERLRGPVDLATVDWLWAELDRLAPGCAPSYPSRPTTPERLREFEEGRGWIDSAFGLD